jgi:hypothetical protein
MRIVIIALVTAWSSVAAAGDLPTASLTPGEPDPVLTQQKLCAKKFRTGPFRHVTAALKAKVYANYGMRDHKGACAGKEGCEVDHLISIELGGANTVANLWPQPYRGTWGAHVKDKLENKLHKLVCAGTLSLEDAQDEIATDWVASYKRHIGNAPTNSIH